MIRAVFFDFYSVWTPDKFSLYLAMAEQNGPEVYKELSDIVEDYYHGKIDITYLTDSFSMKLGHADINVNQFKLQESDISPDIVDFMRNLHGHFLKLGVLANLGVQEFQLLNNYNEHNQVFEVIASPLSFQLPNPLLSKEVFAQALQAIGEPLGNCLLVSGNLAYLEFAASLGMSVIQFESFPKLKQSIEELVDRELPK